MKPLFTCLSVVFTVVVNAFADITVSDVKVFSAYPWHDIVIGYTLSGSTIAKGNLYIELEDADASNFYEGIIDNADLTDGRHYVKWRLGGAHISTKRAKLTISVVKSDSYLVVDLSPGSGASKFAVSTLSEAPKDGWTDEYKTSKLVLRRIRNGSYKMIGSKAVNLTQDFFIGVFELTQKQYVQIVGNNPSSYKGDMRPVSNLSYVSIRGESAGAGWPSTSNVESSSLIGKLRSKTGLSFDLPTEAQWEYACRAGTTSAYNNGGDSESDLRKLGRYLGNCSDGKGDGNEYTTVGSYEPNAWGLYDMHGNVMEWCLDWYDNNYILGGTNPKGANSSSVGSRVTRGGSWSADATTKSGTAGNCKSSARRGLFRVSYDRDDVGARIALTIDGDGRYGATVLSSVQITDLKIDTSFVECSSILGNVNLGYGLFDGEGQTSVYLDDEILLSSLNTSTFVWQAETVGTHKLLWEGLGLDMTSIANITQLDFHVQTQPNPPMVKDSKVSITPLTRDFERGGGGGAIITSGSGTWTAAVSEPWIKLNSTSGTAGMPVAYTVTASTNVGQRVGYVYVSGYTHTITQDGYEATVSPTNVEYERDGGKETISIGLSGKWAWNARPNVDWLSVTPTHGVGSGSVTYQVAPYYEVATRSGTLTVGDKTVTVFQYGSRMKLSKNTATCDYETHVVPVTIDALAITEWSAKPNVSWLSIVDSDNGQNRRGGGSLSIAVAENPSYKARTGTVTIGTETLTIKQEGRTVLDFSISPATATAAVSGGNGLLAVLATPDLPWTVKSEANWLTIMNGFTSGTGNGNVVYVATPNSTLSQRTGKITVTPPSGSGLAVKTLTVTQPAATSAISMNGYEFEAAGESVDVEVTVADIVEWSISESLDWITVLGSTSRVGPGKVTIAASANNTVYPRSGTVTIAGKKFSVSQKARGVRLDYDNIVFKTDGGYESFTVHPDGSVSWKAVASDSSWITVFGATSGTGEAEVEYIISPYVGDGTPRTGWIQVGDQKVYITQRSYDLDITPRAAMVTGNSGAGEIGVSAGIGDVWNAIVTEPWVTIVTGYDAGTGNGTVRYTYTENNTGKTRTAKVIIAGEVYTLTQAARIMVAITAETVGGGKVDGAGSYSLGSEVTLTAVADDGYEFLYWTGVEGETMQNPIKLTADVAKSVTAHFGPLTPEFTKVECSTEGVKLTWQNLAWATTYKIYRAPTNEFPAMELATLTAGSSCTYVDTTGIVGTAYFYWVEAIGATDTTESKDAVSGTKQKPIVISNITYANLYGATHTNPETYQEGSVVAFTPPSGRTGYTFTGWIPAAITADMTGAQTVTAGWRANTYQIAYYANGGSGTITATDCEYDKEGEIAANGFTRNGYIFKGWATEENGEVVYLPGDKVMNLTSNDSGVVKLYAVWEVENVQNPVVTPSDGAIFKTESCTVTIVCATEGAEIYYSTNGRTPRIADANRYAEPFTISETTTIVAVAVKDEKASEFVEVTITKVIPEPLTLIGALDEPKLVEVTTGGDAEWLPIEDATAKVGDSCVVSGVINDDEIEESTWLEAKVYGRGTLTFWWRVSCEPDPRGRYTYDFAVFEADDDVVIKKDGESDWAQVTKTFTTDGEHVIRWIYNTDGWPCEDYDGCVWVDGVTWSGAAAPEVPSKPIIAGDEGATVTGDAETGFVIKPSEGNMAVEVTIPQGVDATKVTVEVSPKVATIKPNGAKIRVVNGENDITELLNIPEAVGGVVDMTKAAVKEEIANEALDVTKGAEIKLDANSPSITTAATREGLTYTLREGITIETMTIGDSTLGDGNPWTPVISIKGGQSGFYSIEVTK